MVEIKYERLPTFCFSCGVIGHIGRDCMAVVEENKEGVRQWGAWLRAEDGKETRCVLKGARSIDFGRTEGDIVGRVKHCESKEGETSHAPPTTMEVQVMGETSGTTGIVVAAAEYEGATMAAVVVEVVDQVALWMRCRFKPSILLPWMW